MAMTPIEAGLWQCLPAGKTPAGQLCRRWDLFKQTGAGEKLIPIAPGELLDFSVGKVGGGEGIAEFYQIGGAANARRQI